MHESPYTQAQSYLVVEGTDMQGSVPRRVLGCHVGSIEQQVLQVLHMPKAAGLGERGRAAGPPTEPGTSSPPPERNQDSLPLVPGQPGGSPATRSRQWSPAEHGHGGAAHSTGRPRPPGHCGTRASGHGCPCSQVKHPGPAESEAQQAQRPPGAQLAPARPSQGQPTLTVRAAAFRCLVAQWTAVSPSRVRKSR